MRCCKRLCIASTPPTLVSISPCRLCSGRFGSPGSFFTLSSVRTDYGLHITRILQWERKPPRRESDTRACPVLALRRDAGIPLLALQGEPETRDFPTAYPHPTNVLCKASRDSVRVSAGNRVLTSDLRNMLGGYLRRRRALTLSVFPGMRLDDGMPLWATARRPCHLRYYGVRVHLSIRGSTYFFSSWR